MENDVNDVEELTSTTNFSFDNLCKYPWKQITYLNLKKRCTQIRIMFVSWIVWSLLSLLISVSEQNNSLLEKFECLNKIKLYFLNILLLASNPRGFELLWKMYVSVIVFIPEEKFNKNSILL